MKRGSYAVDRSASTWDGAVTVLATVGTARMSGAVAGTLAHVRNKTTCTLVPVCPK